MKLATYLSPWLPLDLYRDLGEAWASELGERLELAHGFRHSGPTPEEIARGQDPFQADGFDAAAVCGPSFLWLHSQGLVRLAPFVPAFEDHGLPYFWSQVLVRADSPLESVEEALTSARWALNDPCSLSGWFSVLEQGRRFALGLPGLEVRQSGGHRASLELLLSGQVDACAVDGNGWRFYRTEQPLILNSVRTLGRLGPYPTQPFVLRDTDPDRAEALESAFVKAVARPDLLASLNQRFGICDFVPISLELFRTLDYELRMQALSAVGGPSVPPADL